jgi:hypothetical protein
VSFAAITLHVASKRVFIIVNFYFVIDSVRTLLDTPFQPLSTDDGNDGDLKINSERFSMTGGESEIWSD